MTVVWLYIQHARALCIIGHLATSSPYLTLPYLRGEQSVKQAAQRWGHTTSSQKLDIICQIRWLWIFIGKPLCLVSDKFFLHNSKFCHICETIFLLQPQPPQPFYGCFSGTTQVSRCQKKASSGLSLHPDQSPIHLHELPFLCRIPFLPQPSQFILAWDRLRNMLDCIPP